MSLSRYQIVYPGYMFRGCIVTKNVAPPEDRWAEGTLCRTKLGELFILNRKAGDGVYSAVTVDTETLGLFSGYSDGNRRDIFEGDIIKIIPFERTDAEEEILPPENPDEDIFSADFFTPDFPDEDEEDESEKEEHNREIFADVPEGAVPGKETDGVVFMYNGVFCIQFYNEEEGILSSMPLYMYFGLDGLPSDGIALKITGNLYDDEEMYSEVLNLSGKKQKKS